jgi:type IV pilus assembly protein PilM
LLSIDITDTQIKLVQATVAGKIGVKKTEIRDLPPGCIENGRILDMHIVAGEITDILVSGKISEREAIICINSGMILYKELEIPRPKTGNDVFVIESIIQNEMSLGDEYNITYSISEQIKTVEGPKLKVIAAACPQKVVDIYLELARQVGLKPKLITVSNSSITRLIRKSSAYKDFSPLLLLQVDKNFININLYNKGALIFSRYTKIEASDYENSPDYINLAIFDNLFRTMHLLQQGELGEQIKEVQYFGAIKNEKALHATISQLNLTAREFEYPSDVIRSKRNFNFIEYAHIIGSLIPVDKKSENINLMNTKAKRIQSTNTKFGFVAMLAAGACALAVVGGIVFMEIMKNDKNGTIRRLNWEFESLMYEEMKEYVELREGAIAKFEEYADRVDMASVLFDFQPKMEREIAEKITENLMPGMEIAGSFDINGYSISLSMICRDDKHPVEFMYKLQDAGYFEDIQSFGYERDDNGIISFTLNMRIKGGNFFES